MINNLYFYNQPSRGRDSILQLDCQTFSKSEIQFYKPFLLRSLLFHLASWAPFSCLNEEAIYRYEEQPSLYIPRWTETRGQTLCGLSSESGGDLVEGVLMTLRTECGSLVLAASGDSQAAFSRTGRRDIE